MQKKVLSYGVEYARALVTFRKFNIRRPTPPLIIVHGGAGSGKSKVINSLYTIMTDILKEKGDDPCCPYVVLTSFTGAASANIGGQTLHSLFGFKFGTTYLSMPDKVRDEKRALSETSSVSL